MGQGGHLSLFIFCKTLRVDYPDDPDTTFRRNSPARNIELEGDELWLKTRPMKTGNVTQNLYLKNFNTA